MQDFIVRAYSIADLNDWYLDGKLDLAPVSQGNPVLPSSGKAFHVDAIIKGKSFPKIALLLDYVDGRVLRVVVDGQQRVRAIFDFINDDMKILQDDNQQYAGMTFSELPEEVRAEFMYYEVGCDVLNSAPLEKLLDIFGRVNEL